MFDVTVSNVLELVARMRRDAFSRNRNFDAFAMADADAARARRLWRYLRSIEQDLTGYGPRIGMGVNLKVEARTDGGRRIIIEVPEVRMHRIAILSAEEYELLREHPDARALLDTVEGQRL
jgi:hypothetical protein